MNTTTATHYRSATVGRGRRKYVFEPAIVWEATDPTNPLHDSLVGSPKTLAASVVVSDGRRMMPSLRSEVTFR